MGNRDMLDYDFNFCKELICDENEYDKDGKLACDKYEKSRKNILKSVKKLDSTKSENYEKFNDVSLGEWIGLILKVYPYVSALVEYIEGDIKKLSSFPYSGYKSGKSAYKLYSDVIDLIERKRELINLSYVASVIWGKFGEEFGNIIDATITNKIKISEIAIKGRYKWVYKKRDKFLDLSVEFCKSQDWNRKFMIRHFASEPIILYYFRNNRT